MTLNNTLIDGAFAEIAQCECGAVEHFARIVSPQRWGDVLLVMLTVCFDTARTDIAKNHVIVAGFGGFARAWGDFDKAWSDRLAKDNLKDFHAGDFAQFRKQFKSGWKENEDRRRALLSDLMDIIRENGLRRFGCGVPTYVHQEISPKIKDFDAYVHASLAAVDDFNSYARSIGVNGSIRCVFEKGEREQELRKRFRAGGYVEPDFTWKSEFTDRKGFVHPGFLGLQAAGWLAYEYYIDFVRMHDFSKKVAEIEQGRWAFREFEQLTGRIQLATNPKTSERAMAVRDATQHLRKLKP